MIKLLPLPEDDYHALMSEEAYARKIEEHYDFLGQGEFVRLTKIILKSVYSQHEPTNVEKAYALKLYKKTYYYVSRRKSLKKSG